MVRQVTKVVQLSHCALSSVRRAAHDDDSDADYCPDTGYQHQLWDRWVEMTRMATEWIMNITSHIWLSNGEDKSLKGTRYYNCGAISPCLCFGYSPEHK
jgi:hypothetical protein